MNWKDITLSTGETITLQIFDYEHIFFSLQNHYISSEESVNDFLRKYAEEHKKQLVVTNNVHYLLVNNK